MRNPIYFPDFERYSPLRSPAWRWKRALRLHENNSNYSARRDDPMTGRALRFLRDRAAQCQRLRGATLAERHPEISAAYELWKGDDRTRPLVEANVLAQMSPTEIAERAGLSSDIVTSYEQLFFDCRPYFESRDWIVSAAIHSRGCGRLESRSAMLLKSFGFFGGPIALDAVAPYLAGDRKPLADLPDLATSAGRRELTIQLALAAELLPTDDKTAQILQKVRLMVVESRHNRSVRSMPPLPVACSAEQNPPDSSEESLITDVDAAAEEALTAIAALLRQAG